MCGQFVRWLLFFFCCCLSLLHSVSLSLALRTSNKGCIYVFELLWLLCYLFSVVMRIFSQTNERTHTDRDPPLAHWAQFHWNCNIQKYYTRQRERNTTEIIKSYVLHGDLWVYFTTYSNNSISSGTSSLLSVELLHIHANTQSSNLIPKIMCGSKVELSSPKDIGKNCQKKTKEKITSSAGKKKQKKALQVNDNRTPTERNCEWNVSHRTKNTQIAEYIKVTDEENRRSE